jgi:hypothetical protein
MGTLQAAARTAKRLLRAERAGGGMFWLAALACSLCALHFVKQRNGYLPVQGIAMSMPMPRSAGAGAPTPAQPKSKAD